MKPISNVIWITVAVVGAICFCVLALHQGETISALYLVVAATCIYLIAYRFYSRFVAYTVLGLDKTRATPAIINNDGQNFVPTHKVVCFGHHFAAIAGAGPLVGPILAAQMGYLPSMIWILVGGCLAGSVHDFVVLFISSRRNGRSLGEMIKDEMGSTVGKLAMLSIFGIMIIIIAILSMVVVKALADSPWGTFTIAMTMPIAIFMGIYMRFLRPGRVGETSIVGFVLLMLALYYGQIVSESETMSQIFRFEQTTLAIIIMIYGFIAAILPVWILLAPRDYLSTFLKIGVIVIMAISILFVAPDLQMQKFTRYIDGTGPVFAGHLFPFLFITIACGAISGFHALIGSGTSPKMLENETHARLVGYGSMLMESAVAIMALIAACILQPGIYFAINSPAIWIGKDVITAAETISSWGFVVTPQDISQLASDIGEHTILSRTGGAPTFAIGLAMIISKMPIFSAGSMAFWYHFAILFEALFILTAVDAGTRTCRFMVQDILGNIYKPLGNLDSLPAGLFATALCVACWGYFLYQGTIDPKGGIYSLWPLFGVSNQMLAGMALLLVMAILFKMGKGKYAWVVALPACFVLCATLYAGIQKVLPANGERIHDSVSHVAFVQNTSAKVAIKQEQLDTLKKDNSADTEAIKKLETEIRVSKQSIINNTIDAILCIFFMIVTVIVLLQSIRIAMQCINGASQYPLREEPYVKLS
ncbi:carbon starvation protein A [Helicobacter muridarum]|uniref:Carbon starvation protein A n=1 Tax=Helicobacter muridarum TaxID=216 RepID=A0A099TZ69_9HELI|nr:carbon starvation CstA family protein [Helicobacter muridarum]TLE00162.1 carbon starvation protein A [Helicobacter muridarum]STQ87032.1 carbon starvation protein A [Helicobacter muridarum]